MPPEPTLGFGAYRLGRPCGPLWCDGEVVPLPPKALAVLWQLARQAGQVVTKDALLEAGWAGTVVSEGVLTTCLRLLRQALGDDARQPRYIATVHRLGYRFVAPVTVEAPGLPAGTPLAPAARAPSHTRAPPPLVVGRAAELAQVHAWFAEARQGRRQTVFITGEAGIGKTTLVEAFLAEVAAGTAGIARGQCIDQYGAGEAYLPLLEALGRLGRRPDGARFVACLRRYAPTWLAQLPALAGEAERAALRQQGPGVTPQRMLRELAEALEAFTAEQPLIVVLEDLHWSDASTVEALALLARRREAARLLVLGTYRPVELIVHDHPLKTLKQELAIHGQCAEVPLGGLSREAIAAYLAQRGITSEGREDLATFVARRTEGHPLFMVQVVDYLAQQNLLQVSAAADGVAEALDQTVPQGLQQLIEAQVEALSAAAQQVLEVGSVAGAEFVVAGVAAGLQTAPETLEAVCEGLARQGQFLEDLGLVEWPDGTVSGRYGFRHALYQEVLYQRVGSGRRLRYHRAIGARLEAGYGAQAAEMAAVLAVHFAGGRDARRAVHYLGQAAEQALRRYANQEASCYLLRGLELLQTLPDTPERAQQELDLQLALGSALIATKGSAAPAVEQTYARARALCARVGDTPQLFPALQGLWNFAFNRGALPTARELGEQFLRLAQHTAELAPRLEAHEALGITLYYMGDYAAAWTHLEQAIALTDPAVERDPALHPHHAPGVTCLAAAAHTRWCLGYPAQAVRRSQEALALARALARPYSLAQAQHYAACLQHRRRDAPAVQAQAEALLTLATAQGFPLWLGIGTLWQGWALAMQGEGAVGLAHLHQGLAAILAAGQELSRPFGLLLLAEASGHVGQVEDGLRLLAETLTVLEASGRGDLLAEAYRLQGALLLRQTVPAMAQAEASFQQALAVARRQQAKSWELRTATSLGQLWQQQGKRDAARALLAPIYDWFTEGFETADLYEAKELLESLGG